PPCASGAAGRVVSPGSARRDAEGGRGPALQWEGFHGADDLAQGHAAGGSPQGVHGPRRHDPRLGRRDGLRRDGEGLARLPAGRGVQVGVADRRRQVRAQLRRASPCRSRRRGREGRVGAVARSPAGPGLRRRSDRDRQQGTPRHADRRDRPRPRQAAALEEGRDADGLLREAVLVVEPRPRLQGAAGHAGEERRREPDGRMDARRVRLRGQEGHDFDQRRGRERGDGSLALLGAHPPPMRRVRGLLPKVRAPSPGEEIVRIDRRTFLQASGAALGSLAFGQAAKKPLTQFQIGCTTLPYSSWSFERALKGIQSAGYKNVALYTTHKEDGKAVPVLPLDGPLDQAKDVGKRCRDAGLEPAFMFSGIYPEAKNGLEVLTQRIKQAGAAKVAQVLTFGHTKGGNRSLWIERFKQLGPIARDL